MGNCFAPEEPREPASMQQGLGPLESGSIEAFRDAIALRCIMRSGEPDSAFLGEMVVERSAHVFSPSIGVRDLDRSVELGLAPGFEVLVVFENLGLLLHQEDSRPSCVVICK